MKYKIKSIYPQAYMEAFNELVCHDIDFTYDAHQQVIFADLAEEIKDSFAESIQATFERIEPTDKELQELSSELYDLIEEHDDAIELTDPVWATYTEEDGRREEIIGRVEVKWVGTDNFSIIFGYDDIYTEAEYFTKEDQANIFRQAIEILESLQEYEGE